MEPATTTHPCERVFGTCKDGEQCKFKEAPREACVTFLKGKCRFGAKCREPHFLLHEGKYIPALHPCIRIFGVCKFGEACECANLPSTTCLKFIRGKCAFGDRCKELHPMVPNMLTQLASALQQQQQMRMLQTMLGPSSLPPSAASSVKRTRELDQQRRASSSFNANTNNHNTNNNNNNHTINSSNNNNNTNHNSNNVNPSGEEGKRQQVVLSGLHHPCLRVFGRCASGLQCRFAALPIESCLRHLKGECKFGEQCHEVHLDTGKNGRHPCARIFGYCKVGCRFQDYPADCCLQFLKGRCKFGDECRELHFRKDAPATTN